MDAWMDLYTFHTSYPASLEQTDTNPPILPCGVVQKEPPKNRTSEENEQHMFLGVWMNG